MEIYSLAVKAKVVSRESTTDKRPTKAKEPMCVIDIPEEDGYHPSKDKLYREGRHKPYFRGVLHEIQFVTWPLYAYILLKGIQSPKALIACWTFLLSYAICFGASSQYHRRKWWSNEAERFMQRLDYCGIFFIICGSYSVPALLILKNSGAVVLLVLWSGCIYGCWRVLVQKLTSNTIAYVIVGSSLFPWLSELLKALTEFETLCVVSAWALLSFAVIVFSTGNFDCFPNYFGYHEVFHVLISAASVLTYLAVYSLVRGYENQISEL